MKTLLLTVIGLLALLPGVAQSIQQTVYFNFTQNGYEAASPWNNLTAPPTQQPTYSGLLDEQGQATSITIESLTDWSTFHDNTSQGSAGVANGIYPTNVVKTYFFTDAGSTEQLRFTGLDPNLYYRFTFFASRNGGGDRTTTYKIGSQQVPLNAAYNTDQTAALEALQANGSGELLLELITPASSSFGYLNALILEAYDPSTLQAPANLTAQATSDQIQLNWSDDNANETGYEVYRSTQSNGGFSRIATIPANATAYTSTDLAAGTTYYYRVRAVGDGDPSGYSATVSATTPSGGGGQPATDEPYTLYLNFTQSGYLAGSPWNDLTSSPTQQPTYSDLKSDQGQLTSVTVESLTNWSAFHDNTSQGSSGMTSGLYPANVVKTFFFTDAGSTERLRLSGLSTTLTYRFTLFASRNGGGDRTITYRVNGKSVSLNAAYNTDQTVVLEGLSADASGQLLLELVTPASSAFGYINALVLEAYDPDALAAPTELNAQSISNSQIRLNWQDTNTGETGYEVYRSTQSNSGFSRIATTEANATSLNDTGLAVGTTYYYRLRAVSDGNSSDYSPVVSATTTQTGSTPTDEPYTVYLNFTQSGFEAASPWNNLTAPPNPAADLHGAAR